MIYFLARKMTDVIYHCAAQNINANDHNIILLLSNDLHDALAKLTGKKFNSDEDEIWMCQNFWQAPTSVPDRIIDAMSVICDMSPNKIPCKNLC